MSRAKKKTPAKSTARCAIYTRKPIPKNTIVWAKPLPLADGTTEWWIIGMPNGVDGACG